MADISKWLEMLVGPQIAGLVAKGGQPGVAPAPANNVTLGAPPPPPNVLTQDLSVPPINVTGQPSPNPLDNGPSLNDLMPPPNDIDVLNTPELRTQGKPLNSLLGLDAPDPSRVENTGSLVPTDVNIPVPEVPVIAPPPAVAAPIAARKGHVQKSLQRPPGPSANRPLSPVAVQGGSRANRGDVMGRRTGPMGTPLYEGGFKPIDWSNRLSRR